MGTMKRMVPSIGFKKKDAKGNNERRKKISRIKVKLTSCSVKISNKNGDHDRGLLIILHDSYECETDEKS